jgi:hypothetical protein|tara:strand:+ start:5042 stop:5734 length:693 start_codon:yes stop_codon:yes gene_type:complete
MSLNPDNEVQNSILNVYKDIANLEDKNKVNIKGKLYTTVATRVEIFRRHMGTLASITTNIVSIDDHKVVVKAEISVNDKVISSDYAEEYRGDGYINKTSALENCCTSAIGRALAALGVIGGEYATSNEVDNAINNKAPATVKKVVKNKDSSTEDLLSDEDQKKLEKAITDFTPVISEKNRIVNNVQELNEYLMGKKGSRDVIKNLDPHTYEVISEKITAIREQFKSKQGS